jgi:hypothetical protein
MTATSDRDAAHEEIGGTVRPTEEGHLRLAGRRFGPAIDVTFPEAEALARELREAVFAYAPPMRRVIGAEDDLRPMSDEQAAAARAEGWDLDHGLACPHDGCEHVGWADTGDDALLIVDEDERWSHAGYDRHVSEDGRVVLERVSTGGADTDYQGLGYRCPACFRPVTLPVGIEEEWS